MSKIQNKIVVDLKTEVIKAPSTAPPPKEEKEEEEEKKEKKKKKKDVGIEELVALFEKYAPKCKKGKKIVEPFEPPPKLWWHRTVCCYAFRHPKLQSRLERLMGSNLVHLTDRQYMLQLHQRILEDYIETMEKRIADREARERNREKELVLTGKIPLDQAPDGMKHHPILLINNYCQKLINEKRAKIKVPKVHIQSRLYLDDTPDPPPGLTISEGHVFRKAEDVLCVPPSTHLAFSTEQDIERGYMFSEEDFERKRKYESPEIEDLGLAETVEEMYEIADEIIGPLKTIKEAVTEGEPGIAEAAKETTEVKPEIQVIPQIEGEEGEEGMEVTEVSKTIEVKETTETEMKEGTEVKEVTEATEATESPEAKEATEATEAEA